MLTWAWKNGLHFWFVGCIILLQYVKISSSDSSVSAEKLETIFLETDQNTVISPFSVYSALLPLKLGSDGVTKLELDEALEQFELQQRISDDESPSSNGITSTTVVFTSPRIELLTDFKTILDNSKIHFVERFDFRDYGFINDFVKNATNGLIEEFVGPMTFHKGTEMVIINGVFFDEPWKSPFQVIYRSIPFTLLDGTTRETSMMYQKSSNYIAKVATLSATILELPYKSLTKVLRIYLPMKYDGLPSLLKKLRTFNTSSISLKLSEIEVTLPKFKIESQIKVTAGLEKLGLGSLTKTTANLSRISTKPLRVDEILCKSVIDVSQSGTKAGSTTGVFVVPLSGFIGDEFLADRPFYFEIRSIKSGTVFFAGIFTTPDSQLEVEKPIFTTRLNKRPGTLVQEKVEVSQPDILSSPEVKAEEETPWWLHPEKPEYLLNPLPETQNSTPRFQQPEPIYPSGIRFPYPLKDPNTQLVIDSHLRNTSSNIVI